MRSQTRRQKRYAPTTMTIRFNARDAQLQAWLAQFASTNDMSKVVKLACYLLAGLQPDEGLLALLQRVEGLRQSETASRTPRGAGREASQDALAAVMQELNALRAELADARTTGLSGAYHDYAKLPDQAYAAHVHPPAALPDGAPAPTASSGLDMARRRKRAGVPGRTPAQPAADFDPREMLRILTQTTRQFGQEYQGH